MKRITKAMIFAAGFGTRLKPLTENTPKPLLKLNSKTLLENCILFLEDCGIEEIIINVHYLADQIINFVDKNKFKSKIYISYEKEKILGTGGGLVYANSNIKNFFSRNQSFLTINPDTLWNSNYIDEFKILEKWNFKCKTATFILLLAPKKNSYEIIDKGDFNLKYSIDNNNPGHKKIRKVEKQYNLKSEIGIIEKNETNNYIYTGLQIVRSINGLHNPRVRVPKVDANNFWTINENWNKEDYIYGYVSKQKFYHISNLETFNNLKKEKIITY